MSTPAPGHHHRAAAAPAVPAASGEGLVEWSDDQVSAMGVPVHDVPVVCVGGGIGSFVTVDYLRIAGGLSTKDIRVVSNLDAPWQTYEHLTRVSQIPRDERIRSDSSSRPDNLWGFPSYAMTEAFRRRDLKPALHVLVEPTMTGYYTPRLGDVLDSMEREADRIRYQDMLVRGAATLVRRRAGGGYFVVVAEDSASAAATQVLRCRDVHLALGYAGLAFQDDLQKRRAEGGHDPSWVNAYEDHEHLYEGLRRGPTTVVVRGGGIVASRILERLISERRRHGAQVEIVHLLRTYVADAHGNHPWARRPGSGGFAYQGFNYPKSAWGGQLRARMRRAEDEKRKQIYDQIGGTTTARRPSWTRQLAQARREGWYDTRPGVVESVTRQHDGRLSLVVAGVDSGTHVVTADALIDCTGLNADVRAHRVLADLLAHGGAGLNVLGRMDVSPSFELRGTQSEMGRIYLSGAAALGGYFPGVDTFLGLQLAAQDIVDDIARRGFCGTLGPARSVRQWWRWVRNNPV